MEKLTIVEAVPGAADGCPEGCQPDQQQIARFHASIAAIAGKWKIEILCALMDAPLRFGMLRRAVPGVTQHMLTAQLRELEASGLLSRMAYPEVPPRVEYALTDAADALLPVFRALNEWARDHGEALLTRQAAPRPARKNDRHRPRSSRVPPI
jgi:DNA-binding HxlR family transcriptional regulator